MNAPRFLVALASLALLSSAGFSQEAKAPVRESAEAVLVEVPVRVLDRNGNPIPGLTARDFALYDDGKKQTIVGFDAIDLAGKRSASGDPSGLNPAARRHFLIVFDLSFARPKAILAARRAAKEFVLSNLADSDFAAVATYSVETGMKLLVTFSSDRVQLARAIDTLGLSNTQNDQVRDPLEFAFDTNTFLIRGNLGRGEGRGEAAAAEMIDTLQTLASLTHARADEYQRGRVRKTIESFGGLARALDAVRGQKDVIYLSEGFASRLLVGTRDTEQESNWLLRGETWKVDSDKRFGSTPLRSQLDEMAALFRRSDCVIHAVDIAGLRSETDSGAEPSSFAPKETENALFELSNATGGEVLRNANDLNSQLTKLVSRTSLVYVLAFRPEKTGNDGRFHELKVKVDGRHAKVFARAGYYEKKAFLGLSALERSLLAADVIANEVPVSDIPTRIVAAPLPGTEGIATISVVVEVPGDRLIAGQKGERAAAEIYTYAYDSGNRLQDFSAQIVRVDLATHRDRLRDHGLRYYGRLSLPAGDYRLRVLVRNAETGRMGLAVESLHVPDFSEQRAYLAPPLFLESSTSGIVVNGGGGQGRPGAGADLVLESGGDTLLPTALPEIPLGSPSRFSLAAYRFSDSAEDHSLKVGAQVLTSDGRPVSTGSIRVLEQSPADGAGKRVLLIAFTPEGLSPGRYALRVSVQDSVSGQARYSSASFLVR